ncbi:hypothetical protein TYRP_020418 [Tyrophagus putrescentiae]|nr:hypothetical protein TYRP_020418 [Tyrophagus putrescentiae]
MVSVELVVFVVAPPLLEVFVVLEVTAAADGVFVVGVCPALSTTKRWEEAPAAPGEATSRICWAPWREDDALRATGSAVDQGAGGKSYRLRARCQLQTGQPWSAITALGHHNHPHIGRGGAGLCCATTARNHRRDAEGWRGS